VGPAAYRGELGSRLAEHGEGEASREIASGDRGGVHIGDGRRPTCCVPASSEMELEGGVGRAEGGRRGRRRTRPLHQYSPPRVLFTRRFAPEQWWRDLDRPPPALDG
jgi:hypothetical protein